MFKAREILIKAADLAYIKLWSFVETMGFSAVMLSFSPYVVETISQFIITLALGIILLSLSKYKMRNIVETNKKEYYSKYVNDDDDIDIVKVTTRKSEKSLENR